MRAGHDSRGYTIVEVMIFLAISGVMFLIAATFVAGKQGRAEFRQGINDTNSQIQQVINDVSNGFYPSNNNFTCSPNPGPPPSLLISYNASPPEQGANQGCVFLGKVIQFGLSGSNGANYNIYTVAGSQFANGASSGNPPTDFTEAVPTTVDNSQVNLTEQNVLQWGLTATKMYDNGTPISAVGFMSSFASQTGGSLDAGSQTVNVVAIPSTPITSGGATEPQMVSAIDSGITDPNIRTKPNILICFDGGKGQFGSITIGGSTGSQRLATSMQISNGTPTPGC